jgi:UDP-glucose 4-epimerase
MNILVTGASGFVGLNLLERLLGSGHAVTAVSADDIPLAARTEFERLTGKLRTARADVRDEAELERLLRESRADAVLAGAAITSGAARERETPAAILEVNLVAVLKLLALAARQGVKRVVALSSSAAIGERIFGERPVAEDDAPAPVTLYAVGKAALEAAARRWQTLSAQPEFVVARVAAVFGPWERDTGVRDALSPLHALASAAVRKAAVAPLPDGGHRDWVYAPYLAAALEWMLTAPRLGHTIYNVGAGTTWHPRELAQLLGITEERGAPAIAFNDDLARRRTHLDVRRLSAEFEPPPTPAAAAASYTQWVSAHRTWHTDHG